MEAWLIDWSLLQLSEQIKKHLPLTESFAPTTKVVRAVYTTVIANAPSCLMPNSKNQFLLNRTTRRDRETRRVVPFVRICFCATKRECVSAHLSVAPWHIQRNNFQFLNIWRILSYYLIQKNICRIPLIFCTKLLPISKFRGHYC